MQSEFGGRLLHNVPNLRIIRNVVIRLAVRTGRSPVIRNQGSHNNKYKSVNSYKLDNPNRTISN